jgi:hypothetical protein
MRNCKLMGRSSCDSLQRCGMKDLLRCSMLRSPRFQKTYVKLTWMVRRGIYCDRSRIIVFRRQHLLPPVRDCHAKRIPKDGDREAMNMETVAVLKRST